MRIITSEETFLGYSEHWLEYNERDIPEDLIEDVDEHTYEEYLQPDQDIIDQSKTIPIDPFLLPSSVNNNSIFLGANPDDLDESQASWTKRMEEKTMLPCDGNTSKDDDGDMNQNISKDDYDFEFSST